jgi:hypothetical protein
MRKGCQKAWSPGAGNPYIQKDARSAYFMRVYNVANYCRHCSVAYACGRLYCLPAKESVIPWPAPRA